MCEPALRGLRSLFPQAELTLLAKGTVAELFIGYRGLDRVMVYDDKGIHAGLAGKWSLAGDLRRYRFDLAVLFQNAFEAAFLTWLAGIPRRYGYATDGRAFFLTDPVAVPDHGAFTHQVGYYWNLLKPLGLAGDPSAPTLTVSAEEAQRMDVRLASAGIGYSDLVIGINPGSTNGSAKRWLPERFAETADRLQQEYGVHRTRVIIVGARGEEGLGAMISERMRIKPVVYSGQTTVMELMAAIKRCNLFLTNDTGPMHIAAAFKVPLVVIFGSSDSITTGPFGNKEAVVREPVDCAPCLLRECPIDHRCMTRISVEKVYDTAVQQIQADRLAGNKLTSDKPMSRETDASAQKLSACPPANLSAVLSGYTIFLDRDGTLNPDPGYIRLPDQFELFPGVAQALAKLVRAGARLIVVTNQSGIARGLFSIGDLEAIHAKLRRLLDEAGVSLDAIYVCPHHPDDSCECRKPNRGLIDRAVIERQVDLARSYLIGDQARDMELARRVGARSILVTTGVVPLQEVEGLKASGLAPDRVASSFDDAVEWLLRDARNRSGIPGGHRMMPT
jgi:heptosyltransferase-2